jgi:hypothetical protein
MKGKPAPEVFLMDRLNTTKKVWVEPKLVVHGDVEKITMAPGQGKANGKFPGDFDGVGLLPPGQVS